MKEIRLWHPKYLDNFIDNKSRDLFRFIFTDEMSVLFKNIDYMNNISYQVVSNERKRFDKWNI